MRYDRRLKNIEDKLNAKNKGDLLSLIVVREKEGKSCPLRGKELRECRVFQEKAKKVGVIYGKATTLLFDVDLSKYPGKQSPVVFLDCQEKCPYTPTSKGDET